QVRVLRESAGARGLLGRHRGEASGPLRRGGGVRLRDDAGEGEPAALEAARERRVVVLDRVVDLEEERALDGARARGQAHAVLPRLPRGDLRGRGEVEARRV